MIQALAYRLQEKVLGGLKPATRRLLEAAAGAASERRPIATHAGGALKRVAGIELDRWGQTGIESGKAANYHRTARMIWRDHPGLYGIKWDGRLEGPLESWVL